MHANKWKNFSRSFPYQIYCDMDGVLVDLIGGLLTAIDLNVDDPILRDAVSKLISTQWSWTQPHPDKTMQKGLELINDLLSDNNEFWAALPPTKDKDVLWGYISQFNPYILSHGWDDASETGKEQWLQNLVPHPQVAFFSGDKYKWAVNSDGRPNILIDDFEKYLNPWKDAGGIGILHTSADKTIAKLEAIISETS